MSGTDGGIYVAAATAEPESTVGVDLAKVFEVVEERAEQRVELKPLGRPRGIVLENESAQRDTLTVGCHCRALGQQFFERDAANKLCEHRRVEVVPRRASPLPTILRPPARQNQGAPSNLCNRHRTLEARELVAHAGKGLVDEVPFAGRLVGIGRVSCGEPGIRPAVWVPCVGMHRNVHVYKPSDNRQTGCRDSYAYPRT